jgi:hypothetical protein
VGCCLVGGKAAGRFAENSGPLDQFALRTRATQSGLMSWHAGLTPARMLRGGMTLRDREVWVVEEQLTGSYFQLGRR